MPKLMLSLRHRDPTLGRCAETLAWHAFSLGWGERLVASGGSWTQGKAAVGAKRASWRGTSGRGLSCRQSTRHELCSAGALSQGGGAEGPGHPCAWQPELLTGLGNLLGSDPRGAPIKRGEVLNFWQDGVCFSSTREETET